MVDGVHVRVLRGLRGTPQRGEFPGCVISEDELRLSVWLRCVVHDDLPSRLRSSRQLRIDPCFMSDCDALLESH